MTLSLSADVDAAAVATPFWGPPTATQRRSYEVGPGADVGADHDTVRVICDGTLLLPPVMAATEGADVRAIRGAFGTGTGVGVGAGVGAGFDEGVVTGAADALARVGVDERVAPAVADLVDDGAGVELVLCEPEGFGVGVGLCETPFDGDTAGLATDGPSSPRKATSPRATTARPATIAQPLVRRRVAGSAATGVRTVSSPAAAAAASHPVIVGSPV